MVYSEKENNMSEKDLCTIFNAVRRAKTVDKNGLMVYNEQYKRGRKGFDGDYEAR